MRYLSGSAILSAVHVGDLVPAIAQALRALDRGQALNPPRLTMPLPTGAGTVLAMPAFVGPLGALALKYVAVFPGNAAMGRPGTPGLVIVADPGTGEPVAVLDGAVVTQLKTGAVTALATDLMAPADVATVGIVGAGPQALGIAEGIVAVRPGIRRLRVFSPTPAHRLAFVDALRRRIESAGLSPPALEAATSAQEAVQGAEVVVTATSAKEPVLEADWVDETAHVNAIGTFRASDAELPPALLARAAAIAIDAPEQAQEEAGDLVRAQATGAIRWEDVHPLADWVRDPPPARPFGLTVFKSVGMAVFDAAVSRLIVDRAGAQSIDLPP
jgi:ornithine cyclodeaminase